MAGIHRLLILATVILVLAGSTAVVSVTGTLVTSSENDARQTAGTEYATDRTIAEFQERAAAAPTDPASLNSLGFAYLQKARESGDPAFYNKADGVFQQVLGKDADFQPAVIGASAVAAARHDFEQALNLAQRAVELDPSDPDAQAALGDALIELGRYDEALAAFQRLIDTRPDLNAYVRIAYARELHGDTAGAAEAMRLAVEAAGPRGETTAWVQSQLGSLYLTNGDLDGAQAQFEASLEAFPGYAHAIAGLGRIAASRGDYGQAIELYEQAIAHQPILEYVIALGDVYHAAGRNAEARRQFELVGSIEKLYQASGINTDLEIALFLADHNLRPGDAVTQARAAYDRQPGNIRVADALSWALYNAGRYDEALVYSREALRLGTRDPHLLFHAGMIHRQLGDSGEARRYLEAAVENNPDFSILYAETAASALAELKESVSR